ncbi:unnamed protein product, partial [Effrenium voratum]
MAAAWEGVLEAALVPEDAREKLLSLGYETQEAFQFPDEATYQAFAKHFMLEVLKPAGVSADTWAFHSLVGKLRALWMKANAPLPAGPVTSLALAVPSLAGVNAGSLTAQSKVLTVADRDSLRKALEKKCSGTLVTLASLPSVPLLNRVKAQHDSKAWDWIPWKKLLSEQAATAVKGRRKAEPRDAFMEALACGAGFFEEQLDRELSSAPFNVQALLQVRAHTYAMVGACHLGSWALYNTRFMEYYARDCGEHYRFLTAVEAEEADQLALREVFGLCYAGSSLDDALSTVAVDRDMLRHLLMPRPKLPKLSGDKEPRKCKRRKPDDEDDANGECFMWRKGKCTRKDCKFGHRCALCSSPDHHAAECPEKGKISRGREKRQRHKRLRSYMLVPAKEHVLVTSVIRLSAVVKDPDQDLPEILSEGVPTGVVRPIEPSGTWEEACVEDEPECLDLLVHLQPWQSGLDDVALTRTLIQEDVAAGHAFVLQGGEEEARSRWGSLVASGKLGVVRAPGKKPRLIGDGSISGANPAARIGERVRLPGLSGERARAQLLRAGRSLARVPELLLMSAYWWAHVGAWLVRMLHLFIWLRHGLWLYVDDGLALLPFEAAPLVAASAIMFLTALGVPMSWRKLELGQELVWIGWKFNFSSGVVSLPAEKAAKLQRALLQLCQQGAKVSRREVESLIGLLIWFTAGAFCLRPWLSCFYRLSRKPAAVPRLLSIEHFQAVVLGLSADLGVSEDVRQCDVRAGWRLHS